MSAKRTERLLNLVIALLSTTRGYTKEELFENIELYREAPTLQAREKLFDRDKAVLREQGIPVESFSDDVLYENDLAHQRYRINKEDYRLPPVRFTAGESAVLSLASRMWEQASLGSAAARALRKLQARGAADDDDSQLLGIEPRIRTNDPYFDDVWKATAERRPMEFGYRAASTGAELTRRLQPWGMGSRYGHWYVVGWDLVRQQERYFRLSRMTTPVRFLDGEYAVPPDFDIDTALARLQDSFAAETAVIDAAPDAAHALRPVGTEGSVEPGAGSQGWDRINRIYTDLDRFAQEAAAAATSAVVVAPEALRSAVAKRLRDALAASEADVPAIEFSAPEAKPERRKSSATDHLTRLLDLVPYIIAHQGADLSETARRFGVSPAQLAKDLDLLFVSGPKYYPDELMDVSYEGDRIFIDNAERLSEPIRLKMDEACALIVGLETLATLPGVASGSAVSSALAKLTEAAGSAGSIGATVATVITDDPIRATLAEVQRAIADQARLRLEYLVPHRDEITSREVDPVRVFSRDNIWYLEAWCLNADAVRIFRLDRIRSLQRSGEPAVPHAHSAEDFPASLFTPGADDVLVTLILTERARWVAEHYDAVRTTFLPDGRTAAELRLGSTAWVPGFIAQLGGEVTVAAPAQLRAETIRWLGEALRNYGAGHD